MSVVLRLGRRAGWFFSVLACAFAFWSLLVLVLVLVCSGFVGLSLYSCRSIGVGPCAGRHLLFFLPQGDFLRGVLALGRFFLCVLSLLLAFPCIHVGLLALPLCGAAPTFLCPCQRKVGKRKAPKCRPFRIVSHTGNGTP